jgi:hypothetical protein
MVHERQSGQRERLQHGEALDDQQQLALVRSIGHQPGEGAEQQHRAELRGGEQAEGHAAAGELEDEQGLSHQGEPVPDL